MTVAVCVNCGAIKHGAFNVCDGCGLRPETEIDLAYSLALTDHYFSAGVLKEISAAMLNGKPRPSLPVDQEDKFRQAARTYLDKFGHALGFSTATGVLARPRTVKFHNSAKRRLPTSDLKWRAGFGWPAVLVSAIMIALALTVTGVMRVVAAATAVFVLLFIGYQWKNGTRAAGRKSTIEQCSRMRR